MVIYKQVDEKLVVHRILFRKLKGQLKLSKTLFKRIWRFAKKDF